MEGVAIKILGRATLSLGNLWWTETKKSGVRLWPDRVSGRRIRLPLTVSHILYNSFLAHAVKVLFPVFL